MRGIRFDKDFEFDDEDLLDGSRRRAVFREIVKDIRNGYPTDLNGDLTRALEKAFRAGLDTGRRHRDFDPSRRTAPASPRKSSAASKSITMMDIPPRARDALHTIAIYAGRSDYDREKWKDDVNPVVLKLFPALPFENNPSWRFILPRFPDNSIGVTTLAPLQRLGLLAMDDTETYLMLTRRGLDIIVNERTSTNVPDTPLWTISPPAEDTGIPKP